jgi:hypothetical protein
MGVLFNSYQESNLIFRVIPASIHLPFNPYQELIPIAIST